MKDESNDLGELLHDHYRESLGAGVSPTRAADARIRWALRTAPKPESANRDTSRDTKGDLK